MMHKFFLQFVLSSVLAFIWGFFMWLIRELLASIEIMWHSKIGSFVLNYDNFMIVIIYLGLPLGSLLGILISDKWIFRLSTFNVKGAAIGFVFSFLGMLTIAIARYLTAGYELNVLLSLIRGDVLVIFMPILAGLLAVIGYNLIK